MHQRVVRSLVVFCQAVSYFLLANNAHAALEGRDLDGNGTTFEAYYDTVLDVTWLADANYAKTSGHDSDGRMTWFDAVIWATQLDYFGIDGWRLPDVQPANGSNYVFNPASGVSDLSDLTGGVIDAGWNITRPSSELAYMYYVNLNNVAAVTGTGDLNGCFSATTDCLENTGPFVNLEVGNYFYGTSFLVDGFDYAVFSTWDGFQIPGMTSKNYESFAWAVRDGDVAAVPEPESFTMMLIGLGLVGFAARRRKLQ